MSFFLINASLILFLVAELNELEKNILLIQYKEFISCLLKHKQENISDMEREYNQMQNNAKILQDKIDKKAQNDYELEMKVKLMEQSKEELTNIYTLHSLYYYTVLMLFTNKYNNISDE